jgi:hypothetical protein
LGRYGKTDNGVVTVTTLWADERVYYPLHAEAYTRNWIEQSYKQVKDELGWADFQVRSAAAFRRHQTLVNCAFSFCWNTWFDEPSTNDSPITLPPPEPSTDDSGERWPSNPPSGESPSWPKAPRAVRPGSPHGSSCNACGKPGPTSPRLTNSSNYSTPSPKDKASTCTYRHRSQQTTAGRWARPRQG